ncbi:DUF4855 domain-containing protein [Brevibacillus laterosporus]|uniref:DUF4855 domain-containing protein n=1 Tax=Brevibacillus laterosporus TaxID=1465 RepID=A0AAP3DCD6_BRELA|nr:DUF4855 domain-containing protein [Brevibacillus laterosporus]MCR8978320.1 DUF4855 domain-containing protein [Brevibacillus laterosporus]MCZ0805476.1 DUF4855 domain-containing protein [Brevibacillus laterosporus]MCZ0825798.1 DUF4855 domain-containing protein [Brevibacillus laterosporus]MCZ0850082.1 DUF4855 domain-containing protein [Brevibacillus laterosporus]
MWKNGFTHRLMSVATATALLFTSGIMPTQAFAAKEGDASIPVSSSAYLGNGEFVDTKGHYAEKAIKHLASMQVINGVTATEFRPNAQISRQDFIVLLSRALGLLPSEHAESTFSDLSKDSVYQAYASTLADNGIIKGKADGSMGGKDPLTRQELAVMLERVNQHLSFGTTEKKADPATFLDEQKIASFAQKASYEAVSQGWLTAYKGAFQPDKMLTRGDAVVLVERLVELRKKQADVKGFTVNQSSIKIMTGMSEQIKVKPEGDQPLPFTPIFAFDDKALGHISADGTFVAGAVAGKGVITVTVGYQSIQIPVEVTTHGVVEDEKKAEDQAKTDEAKTNGAESNADEPKQAENKKQSDDQKQTDDKKQTDEKKQTVDQNSTTDQNSSEQKQPSQSVVSATETASSKATKEEKQEPKEEELVEGWINYARNGHVTVTSLDPADPLFNESEKKYPGPAGGLTDPADVWTGYLRQMGREVTLDLNKVHTLDMVELTFRQEKTSGITLPSELEVEVSRDGKIWGYAGKATHAVSPGELNKLDRTLRISLPELDAQYVRLRFPVKVFTFAKQLKVYGHEAEPEQAKLISFPLSKTSTPLEDNKADDRVKDMLLVYHGAYADRGSWTKDDFLPMAGYIEPDGTIPDQMFDTMLFLPFPNMAETKAAWENYMDNLFEPGRQLDALNSAMLEINKRRNSLVLNTKKEKVVLTLPYPSPKVSDWGKLEENGPSLSFDPAKVGEEQAYKNRLAAVTWYKDKLINRWYQSEYKYLKLEGIYWFQELVDDAAPKERELIRNTADMVHYHGFRFYWIPYYGSPGLEEWKDLGFDYAFLQPNYYQANEVPIERVQLTLDVANKYGMGVEIEGDEKFLRDMRLYRTYYNQLIAGHKIGIDKDKIHAYYFGSKNLLMAYQSKEQQARKIYDDTYKWMKGKFDMKEFLVPEVVPTPATKPEEQKPNTGDGNTATKDESEKKDSQKAEDQKAETEKPVDDKKSANNEKVETKE